MTGWRAGLSVVAAAVTLLAGACGVAWADDDDDDDDDDYDRGSSSVETWPPTKLSWPPLTAPAGGVDAGRAPVIPIP